jgi:hypothetical protein
MMLSLINCRPNIKFKQVNYILPMRDISFLREKSLPKVFHVKDTHNRHAAIECLVKVVDGDAILCINSR